MSQQKENINAKQSPLDPDKMENEAKHLKKRETNSTSRPSSWGSEKTVSSTLSIISVISEIARIVVLDTLDRTSRNIAELMQSISWWKAEERSESETDDDKGKSSADCHTNQKVKRQLERFFGLRRIFGEQTGETVKDTKKDQVTEMDSTQAPSGQDGHHVPTNVSTYGNKVIKRMKSALKHFFKLKNKAQEENLDGSPCPEGLSSDHLEGEHEDVTVGETIHISSTLSPTGSSRPVEHHEVRSAVIEDDLVTASKRSSEDSKAAEESGLTSVPLQLVDVADKDVTPESVIKIDSPSKADDKKVCETVTPKSCNSVRTDEKSAGGRESKIFKKMKSAWNTFFRSKPRENVQLTTGQDVDDAVKLKSSDSKSVSPCLEEASLTASKHSSEDNKAAEDSGLTCVTLELVDVADKDGTPQEKEDVASKPSTDIRHPEGFQEDNGAAALPQLVGLKNVFYTMIKGFFDSLTEEDLREIRNGVYNTDVKDKLAHNCVEVLMLVIETITDILSQATNQFAPPHATLTRRSPTSSQACGAVGQDTLQQSLKTTFGEAYCEVIGTDTSVSITPKFTDAIMRAINDEVNSVLSETIQASQSGGSSHVCSDTACMLSSCRACNKILVIQAIESLFTQFETQKHSDCESKDNRLTDEDTVKVHEKKSPWWSCFRKLLKKKVHPVSDEQVDKAVTLSPNKVSSGLSSSPQATSSICSKPSSQQNSTPLEIVDYVSEDEEFPAEHTGNTLPSHSISWSPTTSLEGEVIVPETPKSPALSTTQTEVRRSSCHWIGDSGSGKSDVWTEKGVTAASDTEANETQAEKSNRTCPYCKRKMEDDQTASAQDEAVHTKRSSLLQRIWLFCCRQNCRSRSDLPN